MMQISIYNLYTYLIYMYIIHRQIDKYDTQIGAYDTQIGMYMIYR